MIRRREIIMTYDCDGLIINRHSVEENVLQNYLAIIPARGGSKRFPRKNLVLFAGKPLIAHTIAAALQSSRLTRVIVSTEDSEIAETARQFGAEVPFLRPLELAQDQSSPLAVIAHALGQIGKEGETVQAVVLLQPTAPFRTVKHIDEAVALFEKFYADTVTAVCSADKHPFYAWTLTGGELKPFFSVRQLMMDRQELPPAYFENGAIYIIRKTVLDSGKFYGEKVIPYPMSRLESVDIDTPLDWQWADFMMRFV
jgi:CMP-N,N'-diacetyllegionaminic acid synthase